MLSIILYDTKVGLEKKVDWKRGIVQGTMKSSRTL